MALYDNPPHRADVYSSTTSTGAGAGSKPTFTLVQSACPCFASSLSAGEQLRFASQQIIVSHRVNFKASALTTLPQRGWKLVVNGSNLHIEGVNANQPAGTIPALVEVLAKEVFG